MTVLGALSRCRGNLASWMIPGKMVPGMGSYGSGGGSSPGDCGNNPPNEKGRTETAQKCRLPLTAVEVVDLVVTEMAVIAVEQGTMTLLEKNPNYSVDAIRARPMHTWSLSRTA